MFLVGGLGPELPWCHSSAVSPGHGSPASNHETDPGAEPTQSPASAETNPPISSHYSTRGSKAASSVPSHALDPAEGRGLLDPLSSSVSLCFLIRITLARCF